MLSSSLWGDDFEIQDNTEKILDKIKSPKQLTVAKKASSKLSLEDKLLVVEQEVNRILGKHKEDTLVIKSKEDFSKYITIAINDGYIAVDTETNNSTDPLTCKLMGLCLYSKSQKQAYIPVNHIDLNTNERLSWQITEKDINEELQRLIDNNVKIIYHNASFDIRVIQCTCGIELLPYWDTMIASKVLNNLEDKGLKTQYILHIDSEHGKYSIETLFDKQPYEIFSPDLFALYAATDAFMTYKLYEYQLNQFNKKENHKLFKLFMEVEMPLIKVVKNMTLRGLTIDIAYWKRLKAKYDNQLTEIDNSLGTELNLLKDKIDSRKLTKEATYKEKKVLESGKESFTKSKAEQLETPINLSSSTQLSILFYDILKLEQVNKKKPRSTDEDTLKLLYEKTKLPICKLLLERRGIVKLLSTYIDNIPELLEVWQDGKIRSGFNQYGTDTGRFTSGGKIKFMLNGKRKEVSLVNLQTIPSHNKEIRIEYCASEEHHTIEQVDNCYKVSIYDEVQLYDKSWKKVKHLVVGDTLLASDGTPEVISDIILNKNVVIIYT